MNLICKCKKEIKKASLVILKDLKDFTKRRMYYTYCPVCGIPVVTLMETRISDGKCFIKENIYGKHAFRIFHNEKNRILAQYPLEPIKKLSGWIYGINVEIKNKKGETTQIRQYGADFKSSKRKLVKKIYGN